MASKGNKSLEPQPGLWLVPRARPCLTFAIMPRRMCAVRLRAASDRAVARFVSPKRRFSSEKSKPSRATAVPCAVDWPLLIPTWCARWCTMGWRRWNARSAGRWSRPMQGLAWLLFDRWRVSWWPRRTSVQSRRRNIDEASHTALLADGLCNIEHAAIATENRTHAATAGAPRPRVIGMRCLTGYVPWVRPLQRTQCSLYKGIVTDEARPRVELDCRRGCGRPTCQICPSRKHVVMGRHPRHR